MANSEPAWMAAARTLVGVREIIGSRHEPQVLQFFAEAGHPWVKDDETAWCAAFANAMLRRAGIAGTGSLAARSFLQWGVKLDKPRPGCIVVFKRGSSSWQGHVGFYVGESGASIQVLGGNQGNAVSIAAYPRRALLGYRWPAGAAAAAPSPVVDVEALQRRLKAMRYHEVGMVDGIVGSRTLAAIAAFMHDRGLIGAPAVTAELMAAVLAAESEGFMRPIAPERAKSEPKESRIIKGADNAGAAGVVTTATGGAGVLAWLAGQFETVQPMLHQLQAFTAPLRNLAGDYWPLLLVGAGGFIWWQASKIRAARVEDHREGVTT